MASNLTAHLPQPQRDRLLHIELRLRFLGEVRRGDLMERFGVQSAAASRDLALYKELAPENVNYDARSKRYLLGQAFAPMFSLQTAQVLTWLTEQIGDVTAPTAAPLLPCVMPSRLAAPDADVVSQITRAIHRGHALDIRYHSISSGETRREILPFGLIDTGSRWHVRAFDRKSSEFRDFVLTRIEDPQARSESAPQRHERVENDLQWTRIVEIDLVPHPDQPRPEVTCKDYGMQDGILKLRMRAALAGYALRQWGVDCSRDHRLRGPDNRLWLRDHLALYGVETAVLAPGYSSGEEPAA